MKLAKFVLGAAIVAGTVVVPTTGAFAGPGGTQGPCLDMPPGEVISNFAKVPGANAGPNGSFDWTFFGGKTNAPGTALNAFCHGKT